MNNSLGQFIHGKWTQNADCDRIFVKSPVNGKRYSCTELASLRQIDDAVQSARSAFHGWAKLTIDERANYIREFLAEIDRGVDEIAEAISWEIGKPLWESKSEVAALAGKLQPSLKALKLRGAGIEFDQPDGAKVSTDFSPLGVCSVIAPFNFPLHMPNGHILPALLAGNTIVFKPSPQAPRSSELYMQCWESAGLPAGVVNLVHAAARGSEYLISNAQVEGVFFTGSYKVGKSILDTVGPNKMVALEMGGDSATIILDTSNVHGAVISILQSAFITSGQRCSSSRRLIVLDTNDNRQLVSNLVAATKKIKVGLPFDREQPFLGPLRSSEAADMALSMQNALIARGASPLVLSEKVNQSDALITPGILEMPIGSSDIEPECLAPIVRLTWVKSVDEAISLANKSEYGLAAGVLTENDDIFASVSSQLEVGNVNRNQATTGNSAWGSFGGTKKSGNFRPSGFLATDYCVRAKAVFNRAAVQTPNSLPPGLSEIF